ncbi:transcription factor bHLH93-like [Rutidosis leptorrhynchoides]|uniref:transcription factor bHLH93-like n=1 Tax=Rutidosis leptorrhynchoides TaxID=125765 RepID=UPI003A99401A
MHQPNSQHGLLEDLLVPTTTEEESWSTFSNYQQLNTNKFPNDTQNDMLLFPCSSSLLLQPSFESPYTDESIYSCAPYFDTMLPIEGSVSSSYDQQMFPLMAELEEEEVNDVVYQNEIPVLFSMGLNVDKKSKSCKRVEGQPSKNLMAERRRRKRLNDRLSMLRSIVPKISKMDRTSILVDTIDYMKELMEKIQDMKEQDIESHDVDKLKLMGSFNMNEESQIRNSPKFQVERRNTDTRVGICCSPKPSLLLSTVNTFEALGLDIQQCVISCFNDFSLQASCSQGQEHRSTISCEDIKQILFRNAGYGGRCL